MASVREETFRGIKWGLIQKCTMQPVQFLYGIILARLITPGEMGILGLTAIFFAIAGQLQNCGFGMALIRKQDRTDEDINTVFWFNVVMSFILSLGLFLAAPWFVTFFNQPALLNLTRVSALLMFLGSTGSVHWTLYQARRDFKTPAIVSMCTTLVGMPFTIWAAFTGWSYWAPMLQGIISGLLGLIIIWIISPWKPRFIFSWTAFRDFFSFGSKLVITGISSSVYDNLKGLFIGRLYSPADLGLYNRAWSLAHMPRGTVNGLITSVSYPILATLQDDNRQLWAVYNKYIRTTSLIIFFISCTLIALAHPIVSFIYGANWVPCIPYVQLILTGAMCCHFCEINSNLLMVKGRSDTILKLEIIHKTISIMLIVPACFLSVLAMCWASVCFVPFGILANAYFTKRFFGVSLWQQLKSFLPYLMMAVIANIPGYLLTQTGTSFLLQIILGGILALSIYLLLLIITRDSAYAILKEIALSKLSRFSKR